MVTRGLSRRERMAARMHLIDGATMKECGHAMGCSETRAWQLLSRLMPVLRDRARHLLPEAA